MNEPHSITESPTRTSDPTDAQLLQRFTVQQDQTAFETLLLRHGPMVFGICRRILRRHHEAEDAFQATFLSLALNAARVACPELLANWLHSVARHAALKVKKSASKRQRIDRPWGEQMDAIATSNSDQEELWSDLAPVLDREIERLSDDLRITLILCDIEGKTRKEAAEQLGWPDATVSTRLMKARSLLAQRLKRHGVALSAVTLSLLLSQNAASAALPASLVTSALQTASALSVGQAVPVGIASSKLAVLTQGTMKSMLLVNLKFAAAALCVLALALGLQPQQDEPQAPAAAMLPDECRSALMKSASLLRECKVEYETAYEFPEQSGPATETGFSVFSQGRYHHRHEIRTPDRQVPRFIEYAFDGQVFFTGSGTAPRSSMMMKFLGTNLLDDQPATLQTNDPYFGTVGFDLPFTIADWRNYHDYRGLSSFVLKAIKAGQLLSVTQSESDLILELKTPEPAVLIAQRVNLDEVAKRSFIGEPNGGQAIAERYLSLRSREPFRHTTVVLDCQKGYALKSREDRTLDGELIFQTDCVDFQLVHPDGLWLPQTVIRRQFVKTPPYLLGFSSSPTETATYELRQVSFDVPTNETYSIDYGPGSHVADRSLAESTREPFGELSYQVPNPNEKLSDQVPTRSEKLPEAAFAKPPTKSSSWSMLIIANAALLVVVATVSLVRRRAK